MSENDGELNLEKWFLPAWAKQAPAADRYSNYTGQEEFGGGRRGRNRQERGRGDGSWRQPGPRRQGAEGTGTPAKPVEAPRSGAQAGRRNDRPMDRRSRRQSPPRHEAPLPNVKIEILPQEKVVESLVQQVRITGRSYPVFEIARMILQNPARYVCAFSTIKKEDGTVVQPLFHCLLDDTLWLSEAEAVSHLLERHFDTFYKMERIPTDPPKGVYTFVAQCGLSGEILGPPNYHDYPNRLRKLHAERFSHMPFEAYKARVRIVRDEAVVKKWIEEQSWKTEYVCLNVPEPQRLSTRAQVEAHFRQTHLPTVVQQVESISLSGQAARQIRCPGLRRLVFKTTEEQRRFPLQLGKSLCRELNNRGLQLFKRGHKGRSITYVSVAHPRYLDLEASPVSTGVRNIIEYINAHPKCTRSVLIEALAPTPPPPPIPIMPVAQPAENTQAEAGHPAVATPENVPAAEVQPAPPEPTPEQAAVISDLYWLIHQGHVIEFEDGALETAKKPAPKPPKPVPASAPSPEGAAAAASAAQEATIEAETPTDASLAEEAAAIAEQEEAAPSSDVEAGAEASEEPPAVADSTQVAAEEKPQSAQPADSQAPAPPPEA